MRTRHREPASPSSSARRLWRLATAVGLFTLLGTAQAANAAPLTINNGGGDLNAEFRLKSGDATKLELRINGGSPTEFDFTTTDSIVYNGNNGNDVLTINNVNGLVGKAGGFSIEMHGGGQAGDTLITIGNPGSGGSGSYTPGPTNDAGVLTASQGGKSYTITFDGLAPVIDTVPQTSYTITATSSANTINITDGGSQGGASTTTTVAIDAFETVTFANKTNVTLNAEGGADTIILNDPDGATGLATFTINGDSGSDVIGIRSTPSGVTVNVDTGIAVPDDTIIGSLAPTATGGNLNAILGPVFVGDSGGVGSLTVDDSGNTTAKTVTVAATTISGFAPAVISYNTPITGITALTLNAGSGADVFNFTGNHNDLEVATLNGNDGLDVFNVTAPLNALTLNVNGGAPSTASGDTLNVTGANGSGAVDIAVTDNTGDGTISGAGVGTGTSEINYTDIETVNYNNNGAGSAVSVTGDAADPLDVDICPGQASAMISFNGGPPTSAPRINLTGINGSFTYDGGPVDDTVHVLGRSDAGLNGGVCETTNGRDQITVNSNGTVTINNATLGTLLSTNFTAGTVSRIFVESGNEAGPLGDVVTVTPGAIPLTLDGGSPNVAPGDTLVINGTLGSVQAINFETILPLQGVGPSGSTRNVRVFGQGAVLSTGQSLINGGPASARLNFDLDVKTKNNNKPTGNFNGDFASPVNVKFDSVNITGVLLETQNRASIFGTIKFKDRRGNLGSFPFRLDVVDATTPGNPGDQVTLTFLFGPGPDVQQFSGRLERGDIKIDPNTKN